jgi:hypothetical protein
MRVLATVVLGLLGLSPSTADESVVWAALREDGRVALVRHVATGGGARDPPGFKLEDCTTQRNLTAAGRAQARALGARFRTEGIRVARVLTSQWCRCRETAALMDLGPVRPAPTFNNAYDRSPQGRARSSRMEGARGAARGDARGEYPHAHRVGPGGRRHGGRRTGS